MSREPEADAPNHVLQLVKAVGPAPPVREREIEVMQDAATHLRELALTLPAVSTIRTVLLGVASELALYARLG